MHVGWYSAKSGCPRTPPSTRTTIHNCVNLKGEDNGAIPGAVVLGEKVTSIRSFANVHPTIFDIWTQC